MSLLRPYDAINNAVSSISNANISRSKSTLLTLHFLFPNEFLPALDLLDRRLVTRLIVDEPGVTKPSEVYYVQSASATTSRPTKSPYHHSTSTAAYEVRLGAWNCSCPAFAYSAFGRAFQTSLNFDSDSRSSIEDEDIDRRVHNKVRLGGHLTRADAGLPVCKHILAAYLSSAASCMFEASICTTHVEKAEAAGWSGGWGD